MVQRQQYPDLQPHHVSPLKVNLIFPYFIYKMRLKFLGNIGSEYLCLKWHCTHFMDGPLVRGDVTEVPHSKIGKHIPE